MKGFAIGNGLTDPAIQYGAYADYALEMGVIGQDAHNTIDKIYPVCKLGIQLCGKSLSTSIMKHRCIQREDKPFASWYLI